jgi:hypothetical protein
VLGVIAGSREVPGRKPVTRDNIDDDDDNDNNNNIRLVPEYDAGKQNTLYKKKII